VLFAGLYQLSVLCRRRSGKVVDRCWRDFPARDYYFSGIFWIRRAFGLKEILEYNWRLLEIEKYVGTKHRRHIGNSDFGSVVNGQASSTGD
jgi:hypothetical protein